MTVTEAAILGVVQGLTEFLPVSSSGHLVLARHQLGMDASPDISFEVVVHVGTLMSVLLVLRREAFGALRASAGILRPAAWPELWLADEGFRHAVLVVAGTVPAAAVGVLFGDELESMFGDPRLVAWMLLVTAAMLLSTLRRRTDAGSAPIPARAALAMGIVQAAAIVPGISRSGSTISAGLAAGAPRAAAGVFSFLLAIPAILGAAVLKLDDIASGSVPAAAMAAGLVASFVTGWISLVSLLKLVRAGRLWVFAPYLVIVGVGFLLFGSR